MRRLSCVFALLASIAATPAAAFDTHVGMAEASAAAFIGGDRYAVASNESDVLRIYRLGHPDPVARIDLTGLTGHDKSDIEGAAVHGDVVYWMASFSLGHSDQDDVRRELSENRPVKERGKKRRVLVSTRIVTGSDGPTLTPIGIAKIDLKARLIAEAGGDLPSFNIEGLAATPEGALLLGTRSLTAGLAKVMRLENPDALIAGGADAVPKFGPTASLDLEGRGIRSLERIADRYLIVSGGPEDASKVGWALWWWSGKPGEPAVKWSKQPDLGDLSPEFAIALPNDRRILLGSDDGDIADRRGKVEDENPENPNRSFRVMVVKSE